jgi:hypothetical protein
MKQLQRKIRKTGDEMPPYLVSLSVQTIEIVRELLGAPRPSQSYRLVE